jgi:hypothetical protein
MRYQEKTPGADFGTSDVCDAEYVSAEPPLGCDDVSYWGLRYELYGVGFEGTGVMEFFLLLCVFWGKAVGIVITQARLYYLFLPPCCARLRRERRRYLNVLCCG